MLSSATECSFGNKRDEEEKEAEQSAGKWDEVMPRAHSHMKKGKMGWIICVIRSVMARGQRSFTQQCRVEKQPHAHCHAPRAFLSPFYFISSTPTPSPLTRHQSRWSYLTWTHYPYPSASRFQVPVKEPTLTHRLVSGSFFDENRQFFEMFQNSKPQVLWPLKL